MRIHEYKPYVFKTIVLESNRTVVLAIVFLQNFMMMMITTMNHALTALVQLQNVFFVTCPECELS